MKYIAYTDGGARGNPGPAGAGTVIADESGKEISRAKRFLGNTTNNEAEYRAVLLAISELKKIIPKNERKNADIEIRMDSELVQKQLTGKYRIKEEHLFPLFIGVWNERVAEFPHMRFTHVPREENREADALANEAMDEGRD